MSRCHFIPPYLLHQVVSSDVDAEASRRGHATLAIDEALRSRRTTAPPLIGEQVRAELPGSGDAAWTIHTAGNGSTLPGEPVRSEGEPPSGDLAVDEAYAGTEASVDLFRTVFSRDSYDGRGAPTVLTVHYERNYDNAFWDGRQLVFGDGDGKVFERFTKPVDVLAHEFTHAVTQYTAGLTYQGQSGALNESVSDVFASMVKQRLLGQSAQEADWLIGEGIFMPSINGRGLRSMSAPGTAYDDPVIGKDRQVGSMDDYVDTSEDNGGVHINSGIPNRAFYLVATELAEPTWERAGRIWYATLTGGLAASTDFTGFAQATVDAAAELYDDAVSSVVAEAWRSVGVTTGAGQGGGDSMAGSGAGAGSAGGGQVVVRRSGGFAGRSVSGSADVTADPRGPEIQRLLHHIDFSSVSKSRPQPDRFIYVFCLPDTEVTVAEQDMTEELSQLAHLVLDDER